MDEPESIAQRKARWDAQRAQAEIEHERGAPRRHLIRGLLILAVVVLVGAVAIKEIAFRGRPVQAHTMQIAAVVPGTCFYADPNQQLTPGQTVRYIEVIDCDKPHSAERS